MSVSSRFRLIWRRCEGIIERRQVSPKKSLFIECLDVAKLCKCSKAKWNWKHLYSFVGLLAAVRILRCSTYYTTFDVIIMNKQSLVHALVTIGWFLNYHWRMLWNHWITRFTTAAFSSRWSNLRRLSTIVRYYPPGVLPAFVFILSSLATLLSWDLPAVIFYRKYTARIVSATLCN